MYQPGQLLHPLLWPQLALQHWLKMCPQWPALRALWMALCLGALWLLASPSLAIAACPFERLQTRGIDETHQVMAPQVISDSGVVTIDLPMKTTLTSADLAGLLTATRVETKLSVPTPVWQFRALAASLDRSNLKVSYTVDDNSYLRSVRNSSSRIGVRVVPRSIDTSPWFSFTQFFGYIDLHFDFSEATLAGDYSGQLFVSVECNL